MSERSRASRALDVLVAEARERDNTPDVDWARLESRLMASVEEEKPALLREVERPRQRALAVAGVVLAAAAAAAALYVRSEHDSVLPGGGSAPVVVNAEASSLRESVGDGEVRVGGVALAPGAVLRSGDAIEVERTRAIFERPRKVTWLMEHDKVGEVARARVKAAGEPLVLGLEDGAIEAQVVPVASGEAFAVDVGVGAHLVRVAVHGTHLRVARAGEHVVVDLTEGVVSIGVPPRTGVTYGTLVTAPAHVEFDVTDLASLRVDHAAASVRQAIPLGHHEPSAAPPRAETVTPPSAPAAAAAPSPNADGKKGGASRSAQPKPAVAAVPPREAALLTVRECAAARSRSGDVHVTVTSELRLHVSAGGTVESAQFVPPLSPDVQSCAAQSLYKLRFDESGVVTVPIEFSY